MLPLPERISTPRRLLLAPFALAYALGALLQRAAWRMTWRTRLFDATRSAFASRTPLIVIGSLRAGGAGKTAVTLELARRWTAEGRRVGILAYRIAKPRRAGRARFSGGDLVEVRADSDWRDCSDEAVLLARESGARVFVTRDRARAREILGRAGDFDVLLSDDGLMDARLRGAYRVALVGPGESPRWTDLLPAGPYRLTAAALRTVDFVLTGPREDARDDEAGFRRASLLPEGLDLRKKYAVLSGLGNPEAFRRDLEKAGVRVAVLIVGPDHGLPDLEKARLEASKAGTAGFLYSAKDAIKLEGRLRPGESAGRIGERVTFSPAFLSALEAFLAAPSS